MVTIGRPEAGVALLQMGEPAGLNLWSMEGEQELFAALDELVADSATRVIGLVSDGKAFCAGADLRNLRRTAESSQAADADTGVQARATRALERRVTRLRDIPKPVIAGVNGACIGIGFAIALTCDFRYASDDVIFSAAFPKRGLVAEYGSAWLLPRLVGTGHALDILLSGRTVGAEEALRIGLVNRVLPPGELRAAVVETAAGIAASSSPRSMAIIKRQVQTALDQSFDDALAASAGEMARTFTSADAREGITSFMEKRAPRFPPLATDEVRSG